MAEIDQIKEICDSKNIPLIEDAAHAHGSELLGQKAGSFGFAGSFLILLKFLIQQRRRLMITTIMKFIKRLKFLESMGNKIMLKMFM